MIALLARVGIICAFATTLAVHLHRRAPGEPVDAVLPIAAHVHDELHYLVLPAEPADASSAGAVADARPTRGGALGTLVWHCSPSATAGGCDEILELRLHDLMRIPVVAASAHLLPLAPPPGLAVALTLTSSHAADGRITHAQAGLSAGDAPLGSGTIAFGARATEVSWRWASGRGAREFPPLPRLACLAVVVLVPAHLRPGVRAALAAPAVDPASWTPTVRHDLLWTREPEEIGTISGVQTLLRVEEMSGARRVATLWCDDSGLVWRATWDDLGLSCELSARGGSRR